MISDAYVKLHPLLLPILEAYGKRIRLKKAIRTIVGPRVRPEFLGRGSRGEAFALGKKYVVKVTDDHTEAEAAMNLVRLYGDPPPALDSVVRIYGVWESATKREKSYEGSRIWIPLFVILMERVEELSWDEQIDFQHNSGFAQDSTVGLTIDNPTFKFWDDLHTLAGKYEIDLRRDAHASNVGADSEGRLKIFDLGFSQSQIVDQIPVLLNPGRKHRGK